MLDKIIGAVISNALGGSANSSASSSIIGSVLGSLMKKQGGMEGIFNQLQKGGLDDLLESWIGTGQNKPMDPNQVKDVFGDETIADVAQQSGVDKSQAQDILSQALPQIIDMFTPNGREGGVTTDTFTQKAQQVQQDDGFGLDDLVGSVLGGLLGGQQSQSQSQGGLGDLLGSVLGGSQQPQHQPQSQQHGGLGDLLGSVLGDSQQPQHQPQNQQQGGLGDLLGQLLNQQTQTSQTNTPSNNSELARDIGNVLNSFFK